MPLIGTTNPWIVGANAAQGNGNQLAETLLRIPALKQQLQSGALQNQLLAGQVANQPALNAATVGRLQGQGEMYKARGGLYTAESKQHDAQTQTTVGQNNSLSQLQDTLSTITGMARTGQQPTPELQQQLTKSIVGLDPKIMSKVIDAAVQSMGAGNTSVMNDPRMQAGAILGNKNVASGTTVPNGGINYPIGGGAAMPGMDKLNPGQQLMAPPGVQSQVQVGINNTPVAHGGGQSSGLAIAALRAAMQDPMSGGDPNKVAAAAQQYLQTLNSMTGQGQGQGQMQAPGSAAVAPTPAQVPAPQQRQPGQQYQTPKGPMTWTGTGWLPANNSSGGGGTNN